jgi:preprotein translocase subunit SecD
VAAPVKQRPGRSLAFVAFILIALYLGLFLGPAQTPSLGLDLRGGTEVTLQAVPLTNHQITKDDLNQAVTIIRKRVNALGVGGAEISTQGSDHIVVSIPGKSKSRKQVVDTVGQTALLRFRQVMTATSYSPAPATSTSPSPSASATAKAGKHQKNNGGKHSKKGNSSGEATRTALLAKPKKSAKPTPSATSSASVTPTASTSASPSTSAATQPSGDNAPAPNSQSKTLSPQFQQAFQKWDCAKDDNPTNGNDLPDYYIIACDPGQQLKYILAPAAVDGQQVSTASADLNQSSQWVVDIKFTSSGSSDWLAITRKTYEVTNSSDTGFASGCKPPKGCNAISITLDGRVESAPVTEQDGIPGGRSQISGNFSQSEASNLANVLKYGSLPLKFDVPTARSVSATLGAAQLHGGLIAGAIGLGLVIVFSMLYYRGLGLVTVGSLAVSGLILYAVTTLLGHSSIGYTLSLPGIAGFIVAVGITADSFVVYFERIRDEIREGRRLRSAVDRAWPRARRTILSADTVSLLAAAILYIVSIGDVRGFAFTLGMSTLSDILIVFFFTKPVLELLGKVKAFDTGKSWTGVGKARTGVVREQAPERRARTRRTREA